jgi:Bacterial regulatory proteins, lacI family
MALRAFLPVAGDHSRSVPPGFGASNPACQANALIGAVARSRQAMPPVVIRALDTDSTLCCSVRQRPHLIQAIEFPVMVTIRDVAKESGFSSTTVSIVLNNAPLARYIPAVTKKRIERAAQKLGYRPNQFARSLRSKRSHTVGVMVFDMTDPYCTLVLRGIENTLYQSSYLPILTDVHNERGRFERYLEMLLDRRIEALIVLANWLFLDINLLGDLEKSSMWTTKSAAISRLSISIRSAIARLPSFAAPRLSPILRRAGAASAIAPSRADSNLIPA